MFAKEQLLQLLGKREDRNLEFKEAKDNYSKEKLFQYCCALSNEGGGHFVLGIEDKTREIVGTNAFQNIQKIEHEILQQLHFKVKADEVMELDKRVLVFEIPSHPIGTYWKYKGVYLSRAGESLIEMTDDQLRSEFQKNIPDYSATTITGSQLSDLYKDYIMDYYKRVDEKHKQNNNLDIEQRLENDRLMIDGEVTIAAMALFGTEKGLRKHLPQAETIFKYKTNKNSISVERRFDYKYGFWGVYEELRKWIIEIYNPSQDVYDHLFLKTISTFNINVIREGLLNAFSHRNYMDGNSIEINLYPRELHIISPGGLPNGITIENIIEKNYPRNRLIAETLHKCGLVEREGRGYDIMWDLLTNESKSGPDLSKTNEYQVYLAINGEIDSNFLRYLSNIKHEELSVHQKMILNKINNSQPFDYSHYKTDLEMLMKKSLIEKVKTHGTNKFILSKKYYDFIEKKGVYTRLKGLSDEQYIEIINNHIKYHGSAKINDLEQALDKVEKRRIQRILNRMKNEGKIKFMGAKKNGMWIKC